MVCLDSLRGLLPLRRAGPGSRGSFGRFVNFLGRIVERCVFHEICIILIPGQIFRTSGRSESALFFLYQFGPSELEIVVTLCSVWSGVPRASRAPAPAENNQRVGGGASRLGSGAWSQG